MLHLPLAPTFAHLAALSIQFGSETLPHILVMSVLVEERVISPPYRESFVRDTFKSTVTRMAAESLGGRVIGSDFISLVHLMIMLLTHIQTCRSQQTPVCELVYKWCSERRIQPFLVWAALEKLANICNDWPVTDENRRLVRPLRELASLQNMTVVRASHIVDSVLPILSLNNVRLDMLHLLLFRAFWPSLVRCKIVPRASNELTKINIQTAQKIDFLGAVADSSILNPTGAIQIRSSGFPRCCWGAVGCQVNVTAEELAYRRLAQYQYTTQTSVIDIGLKHKIPSPDSAILNLVLIDDPSERVRADPQSILTTMLQSAVGTTPRTTYAVGMSTTKGIYHMLSLLPESPIAGLLLLLAAHEPLTLREEGNFIVGVQLKQISGDTSGRDIAWEHFLPLPTPVPRYLLKDIQALRDDLWRFPSFLEDDETTTTPANSSSGSSSSIRAATTATGGKASSINAFNNTTAVRTATSMTTASTTTNTSSATASAGGAAALQENSSLRLFRNLSMNFL